LEITAFPPYGSSTGQRTKNYLNYFTNYLADVGVTFRGLITQGDHVSIERSHIGVLLDDEGVQAGSQFRVFNSIFADISEACIKMKGYYPMYHGTNCEIGAHNDGLGGVTHPQWGVLQEMYGTSSGGIFRSDDSYYHGMEQVGIEIHRGRVMMEDDVVEDCKKIGIYLSTKFRTDNYINDVQVTGCGIDGKNYGFDWNGVEKYFGGLVCENYKVTVNGGEFENNYYANAATMRTGTSGSGYYPVFHDGVTFSEPLRGNFIPFEYTVVLDNIEPCYFFVDGDTYPIVNNSLFDCNGIDFDETTVGTADHFPLNSPSINFVGNIYDGLGGDLGLIHTQFFFEGDNAHFDLGEEEEELELYMAGMNAMNDGDNLLASALFMDAVEANPEGANAPEAALLTLDATSASTGIESAQQTADQLMADYPGSRIEHAVRLWRPMIHVVGDTVSGAAAAYEEYGVLQQQVGILADSIFCVLQQLDLASAALSNGKMARDRQSLLDERQRLLDMYKQAHGISEQNAIPTEYQLYHAYPNPFNAMATIKYDLPKAGHVQLMLYNLLGQEVRSLVDRDLRPGQHSVLLNADNLPSGVYFVRMATESYEKSRKIVLLK